MTTTARFEPSVAHAAYYAPGEYVNSDHPTIVTHGSFHDVPARFLAAEMPRLYPFSADRGITAFKQRRQCSLEPRHAVIADRPARSSRPGLDRRS